MDIKIRFRSLRPVDDIDYLDMNVTSLAVSNPSVPITEIGNITTIVRLHTKSVEFQLTEQKLLMVTVTTRVQSPDDIPYTACQLKDLNLGLIQFTAWYTRQRSGRRIWLQDNLIISDIVVTDNDESFIFFPPQISRANRLISTRRGIRKFLNLFRNHKNPSE